MKVSFIQTVFNSPRTWRVRAKLWSSLHWTATTVARDSTRSPILCPLPNQVAGIVSAPLTCTIFSHQAERSLHDLRRRRRIHKANWTERAPTWAYRWRGYLPRLLPRLLRKERLSWSQARLLLLSGEDMKIRKKAPLAVANINILEANNWSYKALIFGTVAEVPYFSHSLI